MELSLEKEQDPGMRPSVAEEGDASAWEWTLTVSQEQRLFSWVLLPEDFMSP